MCLSASVGVFIKQLGPRLAVARRRVRQLQYGRERHKPAGGQRKGRAALTRGHSEPGAAYVMEHSFCSVDIIAELGINKTSV